MLGELRINGAKRGDGDASQCLPGAGQAPMTGLWGKDFVSHKNLMEKAAPFSSGMRSPRRSTALKSAPD